MALSDDLQKKINKKFDPAGNVSMRYKGNDLLLIINGDGDAVQLFIGKANAEGVIKGDRYARTLKYDKEGSLIKNHWERKGKAT